MKILDTNQFISERMKIRPVTNAEWKQAEETAVRAEDTRKNNVPKTYYTFIGNSKYVAKWWVRYSDESGEHSKGFPTSLARENFIRQLESQGYTCDKAKCS